MLIGDGAAAQQQVLGVEVELAEPVLHLLVISRQ